MPIPTAFSDLSTTAASNSPAGGDSPIDGDNHIRFAYACLASIYNNSGNGWTSPYLATAGGTVTGNLSVNGNTTLGNAGTDTVTTNGNVTINAPSSGASLNANGSGRVYQATTTTARGSGNNYFEFFDPTGSKGYIAYGGGDDTFYVVNSMNAGMAFYTNNLSRLVITADGRLYGTALHNNAGSITGTTTQYIASGTYSPTVNNVSNLASLSAAGFKWVRVGNVVSVVGQITATPSGSGITVTCRITLPIASTLAAVSNLTGVTTGTSTTAGSGWVLADTVNNQAQINWRSTSSGAEVAYVSFSYEVL